MSIVSVTLKKRGRQGEASDKDHNYTVVYQVETNDPLDGPLIVSTAVDPNTGAAVPQKFTVYSCGNDFDSSSHADSVSIVESDDTGRRWNVTVKYSDKAESQSNPLNRKPQITWSNEQEDVAVDKDLDGTKVLAKNKLAFDPPVTEKVRTHILTITRVEATYSESLAEQYENKVNSAAFAGASAKKACCLEISASDFEENGNTYWNVTYRFGFRFFKRYPGDTEPWQPRVLNAGMMELNDNGDGWQCIKVGDAYVSGPVPLDNNGKKLAATAEPIYLPFKTKESINFNALNLPV